MTQKDLIEKSFLPRTTVNRICRNKNDKGDGDVDLSDPNAEQESGWKKAGKFALTALMPHLAVAKTGTALYNSLKNKNDKENWDHAGMGDGEDVLYDANGNKVTTKTEQLYGRNEDPDDYKLLPIMNENGDVVSYQPYAIENSIEIEGLRTKEATKKITSSDKTEVIPQVDEKGNIISYTTIEKNKRSGLLSTLSAGFGAIGSIFGLGNSGSSVDNSNSVTNNTGDTYNNNIDTTAFGTLSDAINRLIETSGNDNVDENGNIKTAETVLGVILDPMGYLTKKLTG